MTENICNNSENGSQEGGDGARMKLMRFATYASVFTAFALILAKIGAFLLTGSMSVLATVVDSCLDLLASFINMIAVRQATLPADRDHRFGHGKFEPLAGLGQSAFVFGSGLFLLVTSLAKIGKGYEIENISVGVGVMLFSIIMTLALVFLQGYVVKRTKSVAIAADKAHYTGDLLINLSVIVSLAAAKLFNWYFLDIIFAVAIALYLMYVAFGVFKSSMAMLTDSEVNDNIRKEILDIILSNPYVNGVHDFRTRSSGDKMFVQAHLEIDASYTLSRAHYIADQVEHAINAMYPEAEVIFHEDPAGLFEDHPELWYDLKSVEAVMKTRPENEIKNETETKTESKNDAE